MKNTLKLVMLLGLVSAQVVTAQSSRKSAPVIVEEQSSASMANLGAKVNELGSKLCAWMKENPKKAIALGLTAVATLASVKYENKEIELSHAVDAVGVEGQDGYQAAQPAVKGQTPFLKRFGIRPTVKGWATTAKDKTVAGLDRAMTWFRSFRTQNPA